MVSVHPLSGVETVLLWINFARGIELTQNTLCFAPVAASRIGQTHELSGPQGLGKRFAQLGDDLQRIINPFQSDQRFSNFTPKRWAINPGKVIGGSERGQSVIIAVEPCCLDP